MIVLSNWFQLDALPVNAITGYYDACHSSYFSASNDPMRRITASSLGNMRITRSRRRISSFIRSAKLDVLTLRMKSYLRC